MELPGRLTKLNNNQNHKYTYEKKLLQNPLFLLLIVTDLAVIAVDGLDNNVVEAVDDA